MSTEWYSLSSGAATSSPTTCPNQLKKKRLSGLISLKSRRSSQEFRRGGNATHDDDARSSMSKAAAWMWHTRGIGEAAVLPTKRVTTRLLRRHDNLHTTNIASDQALPSKYNTEEAHNMNVLGRRPPPPHLPMSRFKAEAMSLSTKRQYGLGNHLSLADQPPTPAATALDHPKIIEQHHRPACPNISTSFFYDDLELFSLQELLDRKIERPAPDQRHDANKPLQPFSAIHRLFKRLIKSSTSVKRQIPAQITPASSTRYKDPCSSAVHHVIHHHHHHYYHQVNDSSQHGEPNHATVRTRRRHSESRTFSAEDGFDISSTEVDDQRADLASEIWVGPGPELVSNDHRFRQRRHSSASSRCAAS